jgi:hypothetical protein
MNFISQGEGWLLPGMPPIRANRAVDKSKKDSRNRAPRQRCKMLSRALSPGGLTVSIVRNVAATGRMISSHFDRASVKIDRVSVETAVPQGFLEICLDAYGDSDHATITMQAKN